MSKNLIIANITIHQDEFGRYNLNQIHKASEFASDHKKVPSRWKDRLSTSRLVAELQKELNTFSCLDVVKGGTHAGTYAHELLVVSYAGWISPRFQLIVNQAFLDSKRDQSDKAPKRLKDTVLQVALDQNRALEKVIIDLDETRYIASEAKAESREARSEAREAKAESDLNKTRWEETLKSQNYATIHQYCFLGDIRLTLNERRNYGIWLSGYCRERGVPCIKVKSLEYESEWSYPVTVITETLQGWLSRRTQPKLRGIRKDRAS